MNKIESLANRRFFSSRTGSESGQALVELSASLALLVMILLGAIEFGQIAYTSIEVANAAKAGAQYASQSGYTAIDTSGIQSAAQDSAPNLSGMQVSSSVSCVCSDGGASTCKNTDCPNSHIEETVTVKTQYNLTPYLPMRAFGNNFTLENQASERCGQ